MKHILILWLILFFIYLILSQIFVEKGGYRYIVLFREGLETTTTPDDSSNTNITDNILNTRITNIEKEITDLSGNVVNLQTQVDGLVQAQQQYATQTAPAPADISLESVS
jgi:hypothetical protein